MTDSLLKGTFREVRQLFTMSDRVYVICVVAHTQHTVHYLADVLFTWSKQVQTDRQTDRRTDRQTDRQTCGSYTLYTA